MNFVLTFIRKEVNELFAETHIFGCVHTIPVSFCARTKTIRYYQIGLLFAHKDEAALRRLVESHISDWIGFHTIPDSGSCSHEKLIALYSDPRLYGSILLTNR